MKTWMRSALATFGFSCLATELVLLPIQQIETSRNEGNEVQVVVTMKYDSCRFNYRGLYLETASSGQGLVKGFVRALASERANDRTSAPCPDAHLADTSLRTDSLKIQAASERLDMIPVQPK